MVLVGDCDVGRHLVAQAEAHPVLKVSCLCQGNRGHHHMVYLGDAGVTLLLVGHLHICM